jgi:carbonic anhydrase
MRRTTDMANSSEEPAKHTLTRREAWKLGGAAVGAVAVAGFGASRAAARSTVVPPPPGAWNHDPASKIGPLQWATIGYPACGMSPAGQQSPVNIDTSAVKRLNGPPLVLSYVSSELTVENTGHVVEVVIPAGVTDTLSIGNDTYPLVQYHFHVPSEHQVNGRPADLEAHFVHQDSRGDTAVVGVFFRRGADPNRLLDKILFSAPVTANDEVFVGEANSAELFRASAAPRGIWTLARSTPTAARSPLRATPRACAGLCSATGPRLAGGRAALPFRDLPVTQLRRLPQQQPPVQPLNRRVISFRDCGS